MNQEDPDPMEQRDCWEEREMSMSLVTGTNRGVKLGQGDTGHTDHPEGLASACRMPIEGVAFSSGPSVAT